jgi:hypothetical protein
MAVSVMEDVRMMAESGMEDIMADAINCTGNSELVDEGVTVDHTLDRRVKRRRVETLRMSALKSVSE